MILVIFINLFIYNRHYDFFKFVNGEEGEVFDL